MKFNKLLSLLLCLSLFVSMLSVPAFASDDSGAYEPLGGDVENPGDVYEPLGDQDDPPADDPPADDPPADDPPADDPPADDPPADDPPADDPPADDPPADDPPADDPPADDPPADDPPAAQNDELSISGTLTTGSSTEYNGEDQIGKVTFVVTDSDGNTLTKDIHYTVERENVFKDAKTYRITAVGIGGTDYAGLRSNTVTYTISPAPLSVTVDNASKTFGDNDPAGFNYTISGLQSADSPNDNISGTVVRAAGEDAGSYAFSGLSAKNNNYTISFANSFTINAKSIEPVVDYVKNHIYTGSAIAPAVTLYTDTAKTSTIPASEYTVSYDGNINVGPDAQIIITDKEGGNYSFDKIYSPFTIQKADPVYTAPSAISGLRDNGALQQLIYPGTVSSPGCVMEYSNTENGKYSTALPKGLKPGTYAVWYRITGTANYNDVYPQKLLVTIGISPGAEVADMIRNLKWLPDLMVDPGNNHQRSAVLDVWSAYQDLSYTEKQKVPADLYNWLYYLVSNTDYAITSGSGASWYKGKSTGLSFHAIDPKQKFAGVRVDGNLIDSKHYNVYWYGDNAYGYEDMVVVTLKPSYLTELGFGEHSISVCYWNGYAPGYFNIVKSDGSPPTGDTSNIPLWGAMMLLSSLGMAGAAALVLKKKKNEN